MNVYVAIAIWGDGYEPDYIQIVGVYRSREEAEKQEPDDNEDDVLMDFYVQEKELV